jgi:hypothetical protein
MQAPTLYQFFRHQVQHGFHAQGLTEPATLDYVSDLLMRFAQTRMLYSVTDPAGHPLEYLVDFLYERQRAEENRADRARVRTLLRHLGEYTLFMSGLFRERLLARGELRYYLAQGANAYGLCADYEIQPPRRQLFQRLHDNFIRIADTLDGIRRTQFPLGPAVLEGASLPPPMLSAFWRT